MTDVTWKRASWRMFSNIKISLGFNSEQTEYYFIFWCRILRIHNLYIRKEMTMIRLCRCAVWFESFLFGHVARYLFIRRQSNFPYIVEISRKHNQLNIQGTSATDVKKLVQWQKVTSFHNIFFQTLYRSWTLYDKSRKTETKIMKSLKFIAKDGTSVLVPHCCPFSISFHL